MKDTGQVIIPKRAETQAKMDERSAVANRVCPDAAYTIADRWQERVDKHGNHPFLLYGDQSHSYRDVDCRANQVARAALAMGLTAGDVCAMALENRPDFYHVWFGLVKVGVVIAFLNTQVSGNALKHAISASGARAVIVGEECAHHFSAAEGLQGLQLWLLPDEEKPANSTDLECLDEAFYQAINTASAEPVDAQLRASITAESPAILIYTSGTTGLPKAAIYSHMRWLSSGDVMEVSIKADQRDVFYCFLPLYHGAAATSVTSTALSAGATIVLRRKFSVRRFWDDVCDYQITVCQYIGEICRYLLNFYDNAPMHSLRCIVGAGLNEHTWQQWITKFGQMDIYEGWGATEANTNLLNMDNYPGSCGRIPDWSKTNLRLVRFDLERNEYLRDEQGYLIPCEAGEIGEALGYIISSPDMGGGRFEGYTSAEATEQKILRNVFQQGDSFWRSGDLLKFDDNGYFYFVDRLGDTFRWKSENVSTQEVAIALGDAEGIELINVYGVQVPGHEGRAGMAAIVMQKGCGFDPEAFYTLTAKKLPDYAAPQFLRLCQSADLTSTFKLRKIDLQKQGYDPELCQEPIYIRDSRAKSYLPYDELLLQALGLSAIEADA
ncbi:long-chain-acyl-CoA synthetase [Endozoicomonas ascidiicola]|uniref:long-chain-acyl-CoA synthetase n=1 Tax=Endozoicomonas ascidiicola TaxID=1698521 RepID=UPI000829BEE9|nr:long-chain-acyl-CoA synthetase [Endozoicomonas ascidiicola]